MSLQKRYNSISKVGDFVRVKSDCCSKSRDKQGKVTKVTESYYQHDGNLRVHHMNVIKYKDQEPHRQTISTAQVVKRTQGPEPQDKPRRQTISTLDKVHKEEAIQQAPTDNVINDTKDIVHNLKFLPVKFLHCPPKSANFMQDLICLNQILKGTSH